MNNSPFNLQGHRALITGGGTGLGRQFAHTLASAGAAVILCARRTDKLRETAEQIAATGGQASCFPMDVTSAESVEEACTEAWRDGPVDILVNNAGIVAKPALHKLSEDEWDAVLDTNLKGAWLVARAAARRMIEASSGGSIINVASILGQAVQKGTGPYAASKAGLIHMTRVMAAEWARYEIRVNTLAPGYVATEITDDFLQSEAGATLVRRVPQRRLGTPQDMDGAILLLASGASAYMTGAILTVDGGLSLAPI